MTLDELTPWLFSRTTGGIRWGLDRTEALLAGVGDPHRHFHSLLIGGTNGKGSVAALCDSALRAAGKGRIGLYTSPHLISFSERIRVDGVPLSDEDLAAAAERLRPAIEGSGASFFEATTAMAFLAFAEAGVDFAVVEVGLGGRLDATNVLSPVATAITNIARDHEEYLGEDLDQIAREKGGIFKRGVPALVGEAAPGPREVLARCAAEAGAELALLDDLAAVSDVRLEAGSTRFSMRSRRWSERELRIPLPGAHQAPNGAMAAELLGLLPEDWAPDWSAISEGFAKVSWPGRLQVRELRGTTYLFDVAHNPAGVKALAAALDSIELPQPHVAVLGILGDKEWRLMLPPLVERAGATILTNAPSAPAARKWDPAEAAEWCRRDLGVRPRVIPDLDSALQRAATLAPHGTVVVAGSVHTVGDAMAILGVPAFDAV